MPLAMLLVAAGCGGSAPPPTMSPGFPSPSTITVTQDSPEAAPVITWTDLQALSVVVRHMPSRQIVWHIEGASTPRGQRLIASPLAYGAAALPPGVFPPDGPDYHTTVAPRPLAPGERYAIAIRFPEGGEGSALFAARRD